MIAGVTHLNCKDKLIILSLFSHFLLQETDRPTDVNGGPVSASQPQDVISGRYATIKLRPNKLLKTISPGPYFLPYSLKYISNVY